MHAPQAQLASTHSTVTLREPCPSATAHNDYTETPIEGAVQALQPEAMHTTTLRDSA